MPTLVFPAPGFTSSTQLTAEFNGFDLSSVTGSTVTNLLRYSNNLTTGAWASTGGTNISRDPSGIHTVSAQSPGLDYYLEYSVTSDIFVSTSTSTVTQNATVKPNTTYTFSFYAKAGTSTDSINYSVYDNTNSAVLVAPTNYSTSLILSTSVTAFSPSASTAINLPFPYFNTYSASFGGANYLYYTGASYTTTANFTLEGWFYFTGSSQNTMFCIGNEATGRIVFFQDGTTNNLSYNIYGNTSVTLTAATVANQVWTHIAIVRVGTSITTYVNGVGGAPVTLSGTLGNAAGAYIMGSPSGSGQGAGLISNLRYVNGTAVYSANFARPLRDLTAVTNTQLLLFQTATATKDNSTNNYPMQQGGTAIGTFDGNISTFYVGMQVSGTNIAANTVISSIAGTTINLNLSTTAGMGNTVTFTDSRWKRIATTFTTNGTCTSVAVQPFYVTADIAGNILLTNTQLEIGSAASNTQITLDISYAAASATQQITYSTIKYSTVSKVAARAVIRTVTNTIRSGAVKIPNLIRGDRTTRPVGQLQKPIEVVRLVPLSKTSTVNLGTAAGRINFKWPAYSNQVFFTRTNTATLSKPIEIVKSVQFPVAGRIFFKWPAYSNQVFFTRTNTATLSKPIEVVRLVPLSKTSTVNLGTAVGRFNNPKINYKTTHVFNVPTLVGEVNSRASLKAIVGDRTVNKLSLFPPGDNIGDFELAVIGKTATTTNNLLNFYLDYSATSDTLVSTPVSTTTTTLYFSTQLYIPFDIGSNIFVVSTISDNGYTTTNNKTVTVTGCTYDSVSFATPGWIVPDSGLTVKSGSTVYSQRLVNPTYSYTGLARDNFFYSTYIPSIRQDRYQNRFNTFTLNPTPKVVESRNTVANLIKPVEVIKSIRPITLLGKLGSNTVLKEHRSRVLTTPIATYTPKITTLTTNATNSRENLFYAEFIPSIRQDRYQTRFNTFTLNVNSSVFLPPPLSPITAYNPKLVNLTTNATNSRENLFYAEFIPSIRQDRYQTRFNTFTLNVNSPVLGAPTPSNLTKPIEVVRSDKNNINSGKIISRAILKSDRIILTSNQLQRTIELVKGLPIASAEFDAYLINNLKVPSNNTRVFGTPVTNKLRSAFVARGLPNTSSVFDPAQLQKQIEKIKGLPNTSSVFDPAQLQKQIEKIKGLPIASAEFDAYLINNLKVPSNNTRVFDTPVTNKLRSAFVARGLPNTSSVFDPAQLQKQIQAIKGLTITSTVVPYAINKFRVANINTQVFDTPVTNKLRSAFVARGLPNTSSVFDPAQLQKQIQAIKGLPNTSSVFDPARLRSAFVLRSDSTTVNSGKVNSNAILRTPVRDSLIANVGLMNKTTWNSNRTQVFYVTNSHRLSQFAPSSNTTGDFVVAITGQNPRSTNNLLNFYLDYSVTSDTIVTTPVSNATTTLYFSTQRVVPFDVGSTIKVVSTIENTIRYVTVTDSTTSSVSFATPTWPVQDSGYIIESGATVYSQYSALPTSSHTGLARDNFFWFNLSPYIRSSDSYNSRTVTSSTLTIDKNSVQGNITKSIEAIKGLPNTSSVFDTARLRAVSVLTTDKNSIKDLLLTGILRKQVFVPNSTVFDAPIANSFRSNFVVRGLPTTIDKFNTYSINKFRVANINTQVFDTPVTSKLRSAFVARGLPNTSSVFDTARLQSAFVLRSDRISLSSTLAGIQNPFKISYNTTQVFDTPISYNLPKAIELVKGLPNTSSVFDPAQLQKQIEIVRGDKNNILTGKVSSTAVLNNPTPFDALVFDPAQLQKQIQTIKGLPNTSSVFDAAQLQKQIEIVRDDRIVLSRTFAGIQNPFKISYKTTQVFDTPISYNLPKAIELVKGLPNTSSVFDPARLRSAFVARGLPNISSVFDAAQLQKQIQIIKGLPNTSSVFDPARLRSVSALTSDRILLSRTFAGIQNPFKVSYKTTQVFDTPISYNLPKAVEVIKDLVNNILTGKVSSTAVLKNPAPFDALVFDPAQLQKQIEIVRGDRNTLITISQNTFKVSYKTTQVFDTPISYNLPKAIELVKGLPNTSSVFDPAQLQKQIEIVRGDKNSISSGKVSSRAVLKNPTQFDALVFDPAQLQKPIEIIRDLTNNILTGKVNSRAVLKNPSPNAAFTRTEFIDQFRYPADRLQVLYLGTEPYKLSLFPPSSNTTGDFVVSVTGQNPRSTNNLLNFYLDYSVTSDTIVTTPVSNATTTLYFSTQRVVPFDVGSTIKVVSTIEKIIQYVTVTGCTYDSVSFATPTWPVQDSGYIIESGATVYSQYSALPTSSHTGLARDNFFWFNLSPYIRSSRNDTSANVTSSTLTIDYNQGNLAKPIEVIKDLVNNILTGKVTSTTVLRSDRLNLSASLINKLKTPSSLTAVFNTPTSSKVKSINKLIGISTVTTLTQLQKPIESIRSDFVRLNAGSVKRSIVVRDSTVKPASPNFPDLMTDWKSLIKGSTNTVKSTTYNASYIWLTTRPTNAIGNLFYATFIPSIRQDRYQTRFNTFTLNVESPILQAPASSSLKSAFVARGLPNISSVFDPAQLQKQIEVVKGTRETFDISKLRVTSKLAEPYRFRVQNTLLRDTIKTRGADEHQVLFLDANQGKVQATTVLTDIYSTLLVTPIEAYNAKTLALNVLPRNSRENFYYSEFIPSIRQDRYQNRFNTFTLNQDLPVLRAPTPANLTKPIEKVRSDSITLASSSLIDKLKLPARRTQVFYSPTINNLKTTSVLRGLRNDRTVFVPTHLQKSIEIIKDPTALNYRVFTTVGKTLLREMVREVPTVLDYLSATKVKLNTNTVQLFYAPDNGLINKLKSGYYGVGITDPTFRKTEPIQFWN